MPKLTKTKSGTNANKLTITDDYVGAAKLADAGSRPFVLSFHRKLKHGFTFSNLDLKNVKDFQRFLDKISISTVNDVDKTYRRVPDKEDTVDGQQVQHYGITDKFRLHGILVDGRFEVIRVDPNHKVHK